LSFFLIPSFSSRNSLFLRKKLCPSPQETLPFSSRNSALLLKKLCPSPQETLPFSSRNSEPLLKKLSSLSKKPHLFF
jgi:hypothetical protein